MGDGKKEDDGEDVLAMNTLNFRVGGEHVETKEECVGSQRGSQRDIGIFFVLCRTFCLPPVIKRVLYI